MSQKPKIFIGGDSWGCGEWKVQSNEGSRIAHKGLEQYFLDLGYSVINTSKGGVSNFASIRRLQISLSAYTENDVVFWIQTEAFRDVPLNSLTQHILIANGVFNLGNNLLKESYTRLNASKIKIYLLGGKQDLNLDELKQFEYLTPLVPSWVRLLVGHVEEYKSLFPQCTEDDTMVNHIKLDSYTNDFKKQVVDELYFYEECLQMYKEDIFYPDGRHPNRHGHQILFDYIVKELNL